MFMITKKDVDICPLTPEIRVSFFAYVENTQSYELKEKIKSHGLFS
jgi:hypothetical protein